MGLFPKCETFADCGEATHIVRKTANNLLAKDVFVCVSYNIKKLISFKDQHKLHKIWDDLSGELDSFRDLFLKLKCRLREIRLENNCGDLPQLQDKIKTLLNGIEDSRAMKYYHKQLHIRAFHEHKKNTNLLKKTSISPSETSRLP
ncbi:unnamed protein product [Moneuplotes crassus]|uniref:Uncharacterized protein n=1 Tax=Euplotes crassus TaxID=5936 RepID=A0AAD1YBD6_EUPCR|nr:unnamed protein product [Moneuplotes crassus]